MLEQVQAWPIRKIFPNSTVCLTEEILAQLMAGFSVTFVARTHKRSLNRLWHLSHVLPLARLKKKTLRPIFRVLESPTFCHVFAFSHWYELRSFLFFSHMNKYMLSLNIKAQLVFTIRTPVTIKNAANK